MASEREKKNTNKRVVWKHQSITIAQLEACGCCKNIDIYHGTLEGTQDIMGLTKSPNNSGGLWMWHSYMTVSSKICSFLCFFSSSPPPPFLQCVSFIFLLILFCPFSHHLFFTLTHLVCLFLSSSFYSTCTSHHYSSLYTSTLPSLCLPFRIHVASSTKTTYVSYSNHAIWRDHRRFERGIGRERRRVLGQGQAKRRSRRS